MERPPRAQQVRRHTRPRHASAKLPPRYSGFYVFINDASTLLRLQPATATSSPASQGSPSHHPPAHKPHQQEVARPVEQV